MKERPISFSPPMIRAILAGAKTQTRRVMTPQPDHLQVHERGGKVIYDGEHRMWCWKHVVVENIWDFPAGEDRKTLAAACPYGVPGDILYVKEGSWIWCKKQPNGTTPKGRPKFRYVPVGRHVVYRADGVRPIERIDTDTSHQWRLKVARFMPKWASRLTLEVVSVRVERVQEISEADAIAEGLSPSTGQHKYTAAEQYRPLWNQINGEREGCAWPDNPWVWVVEFKRVECGA